MKFQGIRVLETGHNNAAMNMAIDEVLMDNLRDGVNQFKCKSDGNSKLRMGLLESRHEKEQVLWQKARRQLPTLRIYGWKPAAVSIGYFQSMEMEVDFNKCKEKGIDVVRRITGGGAVYHNSELTYSLITNKYPENIIQSYELICRAVVLGINKLGFDSHFAPLNDILISGKKVSGNAQTRKKNVLLQHGTILLSVDVQEMFSVLRISSEKIRDKMLSDARDRVTGLNRSFFEVANTLKQGFSEIFEVDLISDKLTAGEELKSKELAETKYSSRKWNWKR